MYFHFVHGTDLPSNQMQPVEKQPSSLETNNLSICQKVSFSPRWAEGHSEERSGTLLKPWLRRAADSLKAWTHGEMIQFDDFKWWGNNYSVLMIFWILNTPQIFLGFWSWFFKEMEIKALPIDWRNKRHFFLVEFCQTPRNNLPGFPKTWRLIPLTQSEKKPKKSFWASAGLTQFLAPGNFWRLFLKKISEIPRLFPMSKRHLLQFWVGQKTLKSRAGCPAASWSRNGSIHSHSKGNAEFLARLTGTFWKKKCEVAVSSPIWIYDVHKLLYCKWNNINV